MGEIDDVEHAEDDRQPEAQQRVERAVDQPEQQLPEQRLRRDAEDSNMPAALAPSMPFPGDEPARIQEFSRTSAAPADSRHP